MKNKNSLFTMCIVILFSFTTFAQDFSQNQNKWTVGWTNFAPNKIDYPEPEEKISNIIMDHVYLTNDRTYFMSGDVYVTKGASLNIQEGTIIRCDYKNPANLIIAKGGKLLAVGSSNNPIVFTSSKASKSRNSGDWGGIIVAGSGKVNSVSGSGVIKGNFNPQYAVFGGNDVDEETTIMRYVRIEFSGSTAKNPEGSNGLSLYGLGTSSIVEDIMVSYSGQDSYNISGGKNNLRNLISFKANDDDYEVSQGFKGTMTNIIAVRHPYINSPKGSFAIEVDGYNRDLGYTSAKDITDVTITNATLINLSDNSNYQHTSAAISSSNLAITYINNSKISGFSDVVSFDDSYKSMNMIQQAFMMDNSFFNIHDKGITTNSKMLDEKLDVLKYNRFTKEFVSVNDLFKDATSTITPNFQLKKSLNTYMVMQ
ncbi:hypothetical protein [Aquimarina pacifica]|uniref:hypothetical protein n=1 Tax=Aquimarina pacifica TaxID=1296415 RepID=UPI000686399D|nr:hypothetical protein [Aquimarina pacifica]